MRPTVPELLAGVAGALESDVVPQLDDAPARNQVVAAAALLRRIALLVPHLVVNLLADCDDMAGALRDVAPRLHPDDRRLAVEAALELDALEPRRATLDEIDRVHQQLLAALDAVLARSDERPVEHDALGEALAPVLERMVRRERDVGASIDRPVGSHAGREEDR
jgi:hypothetical protein